VNYSLSEIISKAHKLAKVVDLPVYVMGSGVLRKIEKNGSIRKGKPQGRYIRLQVSRVGKSSVFNFIGYKYIPGANKYTHAFIPKFKNDGSLAAMLTLKTKKPLWFQGCGLPKLPALLSLGGMGEVESNPQVYSKIPWILGGLSVAFLYATYKYKWYYIALPMMGDWKSNEGKKPIEEKEQEK
jgi:hypothetical protein